MNSSIDSTIKMAYISIMSIEFNNGYFEVFELNTPISKHKSLKEAELIKSVLDREQLNAA